MDQQLRHTDLSEATQQIEVLKSRLEFLKRDAPRSPAGLIAELGRAIQDLEKAIADVR